MKEAREGGGGGGGGGEGGGGGGSGGEGGGGDGGDGGSGMTSPSAPMRVSNAPFAIRLCTCSAAPVIAAVTGPKYGAKLVAACGGAKPTPPFVASSRMVAP